LPNRSEGFYPEPFTGRANEFAENNDDHAPIACLIARADAVIE